MMDKVETTYRSYIKDNYWCDLIVDKSNLYFVIDTRETSDGDYKINPDVMYTLLTQYMNGDATYEYECNSANGYNWGFWVKVDPTSCTVQVKKCNDFDSTIKWLNYLFDK